MRAADCGRFLVILVCLACCGESALSQEAKAPAPPVEPAKITPPPSVEFCPDLTYRKVGTAALQLDLAVPKNGDGPFPAVVIVHGSGPLCKGRKYNLPLAFELARKGYVGVTISYRYAPEDEFPAPIHDTKAAVRWLRANADKYHIDKTRVGAWGYSAGGSLACLLGMTEPADQLEGECPHKDYDSRVQAVVSYFAPSDLAHLHADCALCIKTKPLFSREAAHSAAIQSALETWLGGPPAKVAERYGKASPISYARKRAAPTLLLHGTADLVVPVSQSKLLEQALRNAGAEVRLITFDRAPHNFDEGSDPNARQALAEAIQFLNKHLQKSR
jgi:acetyl esterase/lipase